METLELINNLVEPPRQILYGNFTDKKKKKDCKNDFSVPVKHSEKK